MGKLKNQYTINFDDETAQAVEALARITQRKPAELLRLLVSPVIFKELEKATNQGNTTTPAHFTPSPFDIK